MWVSCGLKVTIPYQVGWTVGSVRISPNVLPTSEKGQAQEVNTQASICTQASGTEIFPNAIFMHREDDHARRWWQMTFERELREWGLTGLELPQLQRTDQHGDREGAALFSTKEKTEQ